MPDRKKIQGIKKYAELLVITWLNIINHVRVIVSKIDTLKNI